MSGLHEVASQRIINPKQRVLSTRSVCRKLRPCSCVESGQNLYKSFAVVKVTKTYQQEPWVNRFMLHRNASHLHPLATGVVLLPLKKSLSQYIL